MIPAPHQAPPLLLQSVHLQVAHRPLHLRDVKTMLSKWQTFNWLQTKQWQVHEGFLLSAHVSSLVYQAIQETMCNACAYGLYSYVLLPGMPATADADCNRGTRAAYRQRYPVLEVEVCQTAFGRIQSRTDGFDHPVAHSTLCIARTVLTV